MCENLGNSNQNEKVFGKNFGKKQQIVYENFMVKHQKVNNLWPVIQKNRVNKKYWIEDIFRDFFRDLQINMGEHIYASNSKKAEPKM